MWRDNYMLSIYVWSMDYLSNYSYIYCKSNVMWKLLCKCVFVLMIEKMLYSLCVWVHIILLTLMVSTTSSSSTNWTSFKIVNLSFWETNTTCGARDGPWKMRKAQLVDSLMVGNKNLRWARSDACADMRTRTPIHMASFNFYLTSASQKVRS